MSSQLLALRIAHELKPCLLPISRAAGIKSSTVFSRQACLRCPKTRQARSLQAKLRWAKSWGCPSVDCAADFVLQDSFHVFPAGIRWFADCTGSAGYNSARVRAAKRATATHV